MEYRQPFYGKISASFIISFACSREFKFERTYADSYLVVRCYAYDLASHI